MRSSLHSGTAVTYRCAGWQHVSDLGYMKDLVAYWRDRYDSAIRRWPPHRSN